MISLTPPRPVWARVTVDALTLDTERLEVPLRGPWPAAYVDLLGGALQEALGDTTWFPEEAKIHIDAGDASSRDPRAWIALDFPRPTDSERDLLNQRLAEGTLKDLFHNAIDKAWARAREDDHRVNQTAFAAIRGGGWSAGIMRRLGEVIADARRSF